MFVRNSFYVDWLVRLVYSIFTQTTGGLMAYERAKQDHRHFQVKNVSNKDLDKAILKAMQEKRNLSDLIRKFIRYYVDEE